MLSGVYRRGLLLGYSATCRVERDLRQSILFLPRKNLLYRGCFIYIYVFRRKTSLHKPHSSIFFSFLLARHFYTIFFSISQDDSRYALKEYSAHSWASISIFISSLGEEPERCEKEKTLGGVRFYIYCLQRESVRGNRFGGNLVYTKWIRYASGKKVWEERRDSACGMQRKVNCLLPYAQVEQHNIINSPVI